MSTNVIELLQSLVRIPSPNPPGDTRAMADFVGKWMRGAGFSIRTLAPDSKPEAQSVVATFSGQPGPVIMLHAHIDTVPVAEEEAKRWSADPYAAVIRDGKLYGKGSIDDKAPLAAMMIAAREAANRNFPGTIVLVAAAEEEVGGQLGTRWMTANGHLPACDFIVVGEQTANRVATAHKGVLRATVRATGRSVHATNPDRGVNAIVAMAKAVLALEAYHKSLAAGVHPLVGVPTCNVGVIRGGSTANAVPDTCAVYLDRRMIPGEDPLVVQHELIEVIRKVDAAPASLSVGDFLISNWFESTCVSTLGKQFMASVRSVLQADPGPIGYMPGSDAKHLTDLVKGRGEMIVFGPGSYEVAHAFDEYVAVDDLEATTRILMTFLKLVQEPTQEK